MLINSIIVRIKVGLIGKKKIIYVLNSKLVFKVLSKLTELGYIYNFKVINFKYIKLHLKYVNNCNVIRNILRVSKLSNRKYVSIKKLKKNYNFQGFYLLSTNKGLLTDEEALYFNIGGEILLYII